MRPPINDRIGARISARIGAPTGAPLGAPLTLRHLLRRSRLFGLLLLALGLILAAIVIAVPLDDVQQAIFAVTGCAILVLLGRRGGRRMSLFLVAISCTVSLRYIYWRISDTLEFDSFLQGVLGLGLVLAELYAVTALVLGYLQTVQPLERKPAPLPRDTASWPSVDVYVPTYNESLEIVRSTVLAALAMDWPQDRLNVYILDDGRRPAFREFAAACGAGYIIRADNRGAKAGNINHALRLTDGELIAIFDCDHVPTRAFLQMTVGLLVRNKKLALVQTPHHFYAPDPFDRNLVGNRGVPNEGLLFYGLVQPGNDLWNATFFCGSCAVIRRTALEQVGGVPTQTVTEDAHCSLRMQRRGWDTAYLRIPLAAGLATERLALHVGQRMRWARGMIQILRVENPLTASGLSLAQRLCYFMAAFHFLFALPRLVFLTAPLAYLLLDENIIAASPLAIMAYAGPHMVHSIGTASRLAGRNRHSFWSEIYETTLALRLLPLTVMTMLNPRAGKFNVTAKGGTLPRDVFDWRIVLPNMFLAALLGAGLGVGINGLFHNHTDTLAFQAYALNSVWAALCLVPVLASIGAGRERTQLRVNARVRAGLAATVMLPDGRFLPATTSDLSLGGARLRAPRPTDLRDGDRVTLAVETAGDCQHLAAEVLDWEDDVMRVRFRPAALADEARVVQVVLGRADTWLEWDNFRPDRPLRALRDVSSATFAAVLRPRSRRVGHAVAARAPDRRSELLRPAAQPAGETIRTMVGIALAVMLAAPLLAGSARADNIRGDNGASRRNAAPARTGAGLTIRLDPPSADADPQPGPTVPMPSTLAMAPATLANAPPVNPALALPATDADQDVPPPVVAHAAPPADPTAAVPVELLRHISLPLRKLGLQGPMQLRGVSDLQGVAFGVRADEVVTAAKLVISGGVSPSLLPSLSQVSVTMNDQPVATVMPDPGRATFGPSEIPIDPRFFSDINKLNFRFAGRYAADCNDPLSGLLWATISDLSTIELTLAHLPPVRDLARLPEPLFDRREADAPLALPVVMAADPGVETLRAAAIATSWFAVQADYRGAGFAVANTLPLHGNALVVLAAGEAIEGLDVPRFAGPSLRMVANPHDSQGTILVIGGRTPTETVAAANALAVAPSTLTGSAAVVEAPLIAARRPYDAPRWLPSDHPVRFSELVSADQLQAYGYAPGTIRIPFRTAPDLYTWRNRPFPVDLRLHAPDGPVIDVAASRLDISLGGSYLRSVELRDAQSFSPLSWIMRQANAEPEYGVGHVGLPPYLVFGQNELQMRFDMRPLARGSCVAVAGDIHASIDPNSTIDISHAYRYTRLPNLSMFASSGFPFTRLADLSGTAAVLPEHASNGEIGALLGLVGHLSAEVGLPATGLMVVRPAQMAQVADRDLLVVGVLGHDAGMATLLKDTPVQLEGNRLAVTLPGAMADAGARLFGKSDRADRVRAATRLSEASEGMGMLIGLESPLRDGKSAVVLTGVTVPAMNAVLTVLHDADRQRQVQGDLTIVSGNQTSSFRTGATFADGDLPFWMWPQRLVSNRADMLVAVLIGGSLLLALPAFWWLRVRSASRLRGRAS